MKLTWARDACTLKYWDVSIRVICNVRNELNGERSLSESPVHSEDKNGDNGVPYMPRPFPLGVWNVLAILPKTNPYEAPEFISTDACQLVDEWITGLDLAGKQHYIKPSGNQVMDYGYGLHNSTSDTTLGCGKIDLREDRANLTMAIQSAFDKGEAVTLEVI